MVSLFLATPLQGNTNANDGKRREKMQRWEWATRSTSQSKEFNLVLALTWNCLFNLTSAERLFKI